MFEDNCQLVEAERSGQLDFPTGGTLEGGVKRALDCNRHQGERSGAGRVGGVAGEPAPVVEGGER